MRLTTFSDYALRVLMYAASHKGRLITIEETADFYRISRGHLMKVVNILTRAGFLRGVRGRAGGFMLARSPEEIDLGAVVRATEPDFALVECFGRDNACVISRDCRLPNVLNEALSAFVSVFDRYTLADLPLAVRNFAPPDDISQVIRGPKIERNSKQTERKER